MIYIALEGTDFIGKDTALERFKEETEYNVLYTREPGGSPLGQKIRELLLDPANEMDKVTEALLFAADRSIHIKDLIEKAPEYDILISNRTFYSSLVYQTNSNSISRDEVYRLNRYACRGFMPTHLIIFYIEDKVKFNERVALSGRERDRIESKGNDFLYELNMKYKDLYDENDPDIYLIECSGSKEEVYKQFKNIIENIYSEERSF